MDICVIIPTFNRFELLKKAVKSVIEQTYKAKQIIIIDDGSSDNTKRICEIFPQVEYFYKKNGGVSSARNEGIKKAKCEYIAFLDSDDEFMPQKLSLHVKAHLQNENLQISYTNEIWMKNNCIQKQPKKFKKYSGYIFDKCLDYCIIAPSSVFMRAKIFDEVGLFDESLQVCEDYDMWLRILHKYDILLLEQELTIKHSRSDDQLSTKFWGMDTFRVKSLQNLYPHVNSIQQILIKNVLIKKLNILIKGAKKHKNDILLQKYEKILNLAYQGQI